MSEYIKIVIEVDDFIPHQQGFRANKRGAVYSTNGYRQYEKVIREAVLTQLPLDYERIPKPDAAVLDVYFEYPERKRPKQVERREYKTTRPDGTNLWKSVEDAIEGLIYEDDSQVQLNRLERCYVKGLERRRICIYVLAVAR